MKRSEGIVCRVEGRFLSMLIEGRKRCWDKIETEGREENNRIGEEDNGSIYSVEADRSMEH